MISSLARRKPFLKSITEALSDVSRRTLTRERFRRGYVSEHGLLPFVLRNCRLNASCASQITKPSYSTETEGNRELDSVRFDRISNETLESLSEYFDELVERASHLSDADVNYGDGVLTVKFGTKEGTYVINRQAPNKQIWLSSPLSGPKRYDFIDGKWSYKHDGITLHELLNKEIPTIVKIETYFDECSYGGNEPRSL